MHEPELKALEYEKYICTECYQFGAHNEVTYGNWWKYCCQFAIFAPLIVIPSAAYLTLLFGLFVLAKGRFVAIDTMDLFPLWRYMPKKPHTVTVCPHCKRVNCQAKIKDGNGQTALYFHKKHGLHKGEYKREQKDTPPEPTAAPEKRKIDPNEF